MRFSISRSSLLPALQISEAVAKKNKQMPILGHVLINVTEDQIEISGTDLNTQITTTASIAETSQAGTPEPGSFSTPASKLADLVRLSQDGSIFDFKLEDERLMLQCGKSRYRLVQLPPEQFPSFSEEDDQTVSVLRIPAEVFLAALSRVKFAMAKDDVRYSLNGLNFDVKSGSIVTTATNGHILSNCLTVIEPTEERPDPQLADSRIFPRSAVLELVSMLGRMTSQGPALFVDVLVGRRHARITLGNVTLHTKFIDSKYPDFNRLIQSSFETVFTVNSSEIRSVIDRSLVIGKDDADSIIVDVTPEGVEISLTNQEMESITEKIPCVAFEGEPAKLGFNGKYLKNAIEQVDSDETRISMTANSLYVSDPNHSGWLALVLPRRI